MFFSKANKLQKIIWNTYDYVENILFDIDNEYTLSNEEIERLCNILILLSKEDVKQMITTHKRSLNDPIFMKKFGKSKLQERYNFIIPILEKQLKEYEEENN